jgi:hypothetical protein
MLKPTGFRGLVPQFRRVLLTMFVLILLSALLPVGKARATIGSFSASIMCGVGSFDLGYAFRGVYQGQWAIYRLFIGTQDQNAQFSLKTVTPWYYVQLAGPSGITTSKHTFLIPSGSTISIVTEVQYWNGSYWETGGTQLWPHYKPFASSPNDLPWCTVY